MKKIILITAIFINFSYSFSQSKKEQIVTLQNTLDSFQFELNNVLLIKNNLTLYSDSITKILLEKQSITKAIKDTNNNFETEFKHSRNKIDSLILVKELKEKELKEIQNEFAEAIKKKNAENEVIVGIQTWMRKDLATEYFNNGDKISQVKNEKEWIKLSKNKVPCFIKMKNGKALYNGYVIVDKRGICPDGYNIPTLNDFNDLLKHIGINDFYNGDYNNKYNKIASLLTYDIESSDLSTNDVFKGTNTTGFSATEGGFIGSGWETLEEKDNPQNCNYWWTNTSEKTKQEQNKNSEDVRSLNSSFYVFQIGFCGEDGYFEQYDKKTNKFIPTAPPLDYGFAIRCIKSN
jgi:uncharacterized protein (TIGR02145 family)